MKNGKTDVVSIDRLKPAFIYVDNNIELEKSRERESEITQPESESENLETDSVPETTSEVTNLDYRAALLRDLKSLSRDKPKRKYEKKDVYRGTATTRSGRSSRPPSRF